MYDELLKLISDPNVQANVQGVSANPVFHNFLDKSIEILDKTNGILNMASEALVRIYGLLFEKSPLHATVINLEMFSDPESIRKVAEETTKTVTQNVDLELQETLESIRNPCYKSCNLK